MLTLGLATSLVKDNSETSAHWMYLWQMNKLRQRMDPLPKAICIEVFLNTSNGEYLYVWLI